MNTVTDIIGEEYKDQWDRLNEYDGDGQYQYGGGNCIFISAPTGSGKTYFILQIWFKYLAGKQKKMLYLVNRTILKENIENKISMMCNDEDRFIDVKLYQKIESELKADEYVQRKHDDGYSVKNKAYICKYMREKYSEYECVVCDECHYFLTDSNFNTDTSLSFRMIQDCFAHKIRIFMSATITDIKMYIKNYDFKRASSDVEKKYYWVDIDSKLEEKSKYFKLLPNYHVCEYFEEYKIDSDYDYLDIQIMNNTHGVYNKIAKITESMDVAEITECTDASTNDSGETDKDKGKWLIFVDDKNLGRELEKKLGVEKAVFISAENKRDRDKSDTVSGIVINEKSNKQYLIATSVLDNGINLNDCQLRNIVLMADIETEFIQMLGRKRADGKKVKLYIYQYDKKHFEKRLQSVEKRLGIAKEYVGYMKDCEQKYCNQYEEDRSIQHLHIYRMREIADEKIAVEDVRSLFHVYGGVFYLNLLAYQNLKNLKNFYEKVIDEFDKIGEDAFVRIQLGWLGIDGEKADMIIKDSKLTTVEKYRKQINDWMEKISNHPMNKEAYRNELKDIRTQINFLADATEDKEGFKGNTVQDIKKGDRILSSNHLKYLKIFYEIPYKVTTKKSTYTIIKEE